jgi:hypothetical protein
MELYPKEAFVSALGATRKTVAFLVGSPFSTDISGKGVPGIIPILDIIREVVMEETPLGVTRYDNEVSGKTGTYAYQSAMGWLQANVHQDAVNTVIRRAVLKSCLDTSTVGNPVKPTCDGEPIKWFLPAGTRSLASLITSAPLRFSGPILTSNFDPLLSLAIKDAGGNASRRVLDSDGALPRDIEDELDTRHVVHFHGYWRDSDTLHTPTQLRSSRPKLKASLQRLLRKHVLVVVAYGGWDDAFTNALAELLHDDQAELEVLWCFNESVPAVVKEEYKQLLDSVAPAIIRGRFRCYGGIDCHTIFSEIITSSCTTTTYTNVTPSNKPNIGDQSIVNISCHDQRGDMDFVGRYLAKRLDDALESFSSQPKIWIDPIIAESPEVAKDVDAAVMIDLADLIADSQSTIIKAPPQFGLTCLAHYLAKEAWGGKEKCLWIYLDTKNLKPNIASIDKAVETELMLLGCDKDKIKCIIIDSWTSSEKNSQIILQLVCNHFKDVRIIVFETIHVDRLLDQTEMMSLDRDFEVLYLWTLPRGHVRKVVSGYNNVKHIGDEDSVTAKIVTDLEVLNLHRTPMNCIILLKVSEVYFDESPVNRTEMINRILFLLFNVDDIPTYKVRPDLKDCEFVLGYFCERMIRDCKYFFARDYFIDELKQCCKKSFIDLEVQVVFDVLTANHIIIKRGDLFQFRFVYWIYYFAAQRMHHDKEFAKFIYEDMRYAKYPEIIEFYTGIDRRREDALLILTKDVRANCDKVQAKCGLPDKLNPYKYAQWRPTAETLEHMKSEITDGVNRSNLPASVKDKYADRLYDRTRPYDQEIREILTEYSFEYMVQTMRAGARALRNSDYVNPETKRELLNEIMRCWHHVSNVLLILAPLLALHRRAAFDGYGFLLVGCLNNTPEERLQALLNEIPAIVVNWYKEDLFSQKMGPLLIDKMVNEQYQLIRHKLILLMIDQRPRGWRIQVQNYIGDAKKDSFYLWNVYSSLRAQYRFSFASPETLNDMRYLIKMAIAKHETGGRIPSLNLINKFKNAIPIREIKQDV